MVKKFDFKKFSEHKTNTEQSVGLILVEGEDDANFIYFLIKNSESFAKDFLKRNYIFYLGGKNKLLGGKEKDGHCGLRKIVEDQDFKDSCTKVAVIFDADANIDDNFKEIIKDFQIINEEQKKLGKYYPKIKFNLPKKSSVIDVQESSALNPTVSIFLLPNSKDSGSLEDLYLSTLDKKDRAILKCLEGKEIDKCVSENLSLSHKTKLLTQSFLAAKDKTFKTIGFAASAGKVNFNSPALDKLKNFLKNFSNS